MYARTLLTLAAVGAVIAVACAGDSQETDKPAPDKAATDKAATDKAATDKAATDKAAAEKVPPRPIVYAMLNDGTYIEGTLTAFDGGAYTVEVEGERRTFAAADVRSIVLHTPPAKKERPRLARSFEEMIAEMRADPAAEKPGSTVVIDYAAQGEEGLPPLLAELRKDSSTIAWAAGKVFYALGRENLPTLVRIARDEKSQGVRRAVQIALRSHADLALPQIRELMTDEDAELRGMALGLLYDRSVQSGTIIPKQFTEPLIALLDDERSQTQSNAAQILGRMNHSSTRIVPVLIEKIAADRTSTVATPAIYGLMMLAREAGGSSATGKTIAAALAKTIADHDNASVRSTAATSLAQLGSHVAPAVEALRKAARDDGAEAVRKAALVTLRKTGNALLAELEPLDLREDDLKAIRGILAEPEHGQEDLYIRRNHAVIDLIRAGPRTLEALMIVVRQDDRSSYWNIVASVMGGWKKPAIERIEEYSNDEHTLVRRAVAMSLGRMGDVDKMPETLPILLDDKDEWVRYTALRSISELSKQRNAAVRNHAIELMARGLGDAKMAREVWWDVSRQLAVLAVVDKSALAAIAKIIKESSNEHYRGRAARELGNAAGSLSAKDEMFKPALDVLVAFLGREENRREWSNVIYSLDGMASTSDAALAVVEKWTKSDEPMAATAASEIRARVKERRSNTKPSDAPF
jgi:HEAT repeat protein